MNNIKNDNIYNKMTKEESAYVIWNLKCDVDKKFEEFYNITDSVNYGNMIFGRMDSVLPTEEEFLPISDYYFNKSQFDFCLDEIKENPSSENAIIYFEGIYNKSDKRFCDIPMIKFEYQDGVLAAKVLAKRCPEKKDVILFTAILHIFANELVRYLKINELNISFSSFKDRYFVLEDKENDCCYKIKKTDIEKIINYEYNLRVKKSKKIVSDVSETVKNIVSPL